MATFLQLVNDLERESGTVQKAARLVTVANAPNRQEKIVEWVRDAWEIIQTSRTDWQWLRKEFQTDLLANQARYTPTALSVADFARWFPTSCCDAFTIYDTALGKADETEIQRIDWSTFKAKWDRGVHTANRPIEVAVAPDNRLCFGPTPNKAYTLRGEYYRKPQVLAADGDVPLCPEQHHNAIVWRALMLLGDHDEAPAVVATSTAKFQSAFRRLVDDSVGEVSL